MSQNTSKHRKLNDFFKSSKDNQTLSHCTKKFKQNELEEKKMVNKLNPF